MNNHPDRTNILWICTDQQRYDTLGCYGNEHVHSPNIDRLAREGALFERCYSQSPVCTPSRAGFLTGRYPRTTRCRQNGQMIPPDEVLVTRILAENGYTCGLSGKLHVGPCNPSVTPDIEPRIRDGYSAFHWSHHPRPDWPCNEYVRWLADQGEIYSTPVSPHSPHVLEGMPVELHQTTWCVTKAIDFVEAVRGRETPWCFSVNMYDPHHPFDPPPSYLERYLPDIDSIPLPAGHGSNSEWASPFHQQDHGGAYNTNGSYPYEQMTDRDHRAVRAAYWAMCDLIDEQVGRLVAYLDETGQRENTMIIFTSDHGEMLGDHGIYLKGPYFYDCAVRVPLVVSQPGTIGPHRHQGLVELCDLAPTVLDACGIPPYEGMQTRSFYDVLTGDEPGDQLRSDVYSEYYNAMPWHRDPLPYATMVRDERYKLVRYHGAEAGELFDLETDPDELTNLWSMESMVGVKCRMLELMTDRMAYTVDPLPRREAPW